MKKLLIALILSALVLTGCGMFSTHHAWKQAQQENPLQVPPGMDRPTTSAALTIPPPSVPTSQPAAPATRKVVSNATSMHLDDDVDTAYQRVGLALQQGGIGTVTGQSAAQHTYEVKVASKAVVASSPTFLQKHFSNLQQSGTADAGNKLGANQAGTVITLKVTPAQGGGSTISAAGDPQKAVQVIGALSGRLGS